MFVRWGWWAVPLLGKSCFDLHKWNYEIHSYWVAVCWSKDEGSIPLPSSDKMQLWTNLEWMFDLESICYPWAKSVVFGVFLWKWEKVLESYKDRGEGNNCFIQFIQLVTDLTGLHWKGAHCITIMGQASRGYPNDRVPLQNVVRFPIFSMRKLSPFWNEWFLPCSVSLQIQSVRPSVIISILEVRGNRFSTETCSTSFKASG